MACKAAYLLQKVKTCCRRILRLLFTILITPSLSPAAEPDAGSESRLAPLGLEKPMDMKVTTVTRPSTHPSSVVTLNGFSFPHALANIEARLAWGPPEGLELAMVGQNLTDNHYPESGTGAP